MKSQIILVAGGAGYVGTTLVRDALSKGYKVKCLDLLIYGGKSLSVFFNHPNFEFIYGDIRNKNLLNKILKNVDYVINLAAIVGDKPCQAAPESAHSININGAKILANCAKNKGIKKYIFSSTCSNYGVTDPKIFIDEDGDLNPMSLYAETKIDTEKYLKEISSKNFATTSLRFATAFGISARTRFDLAVNSFAYEAFTDKEITVFASNTWRPYVHVSDIAGIILECLELNNKVIAGKIFNAGSTSQNFTKKEIVDIFLKKIPELKVNYINSIDDKRTYKVSFSRIEKILPKYKFKLVISGISELLSAFQTGVLTDKDYESNNLNTITSFFEKKEKFLIDTEI